MDWRKIKYIERIVHRSSKYKTRVLYQPIAPIIIFCETYIAYIHYSAAVRHLTNIEVYCQHTGP